MRKAGHRSPATKVYKSCFHEPKDVLMKASPKLDELLVVELSHSSKKQKKVISHVNTQRQTERPSSL